MRTNIKLVKQLAESSDNLFVQETRLTNKLTFEQLVNLKHAKTTYHKSNQRVSGKGRPSADIGWVISSSLQHTVEFKSNFISVLKLKNLAVIGVYTKFNRRTQKSYDDYERDLIATIKIHQELKAQRYEVLITGDFNSDLYRPGKFDQILSKHLHLNDLYCLDLLNAQKTRYTYFNLFKLQMQVNKEKCGINKGDHLPLRVTVATENLYQQRRTKEQKRIKYDWNNRDFVERYGEILDRKLRIELANFYNALAGTEDLKATLTMAVSTMHQAMQNAAKEATSPSFKLPKRFKKAHSWWCEELEQLHRAKQEIWYQYKHTGFQCEHIKAKYKQAKTHFRRI